MQELLDIIQKLNVPTDELRIEVLQDVLKKAKQYRAKEAKYEIEAESLHYWTELSNELWMHLLKGFKNFEDQLLCATCFFSTLPFNDKEVFYLNSILEIIKLELSTRSNTSLAVSLMYGIFQSTFFTFKVENVKLISSVLELVFDLLVLMGYEYTKYTFLSFKIINSFQKLCGTTLNNVIFNTNNQIKLLNLVNHNWENPITGVRDLNKSIFQTIIKVIEDPTYKLVIEEINGFYWNKAKYLMLSEIIESRVNDVGALSECDWIEGLMYSLHKPGLVSAGSDMYYAILKNMNTEDNWCSLFMKHIIKILTGTSNKAIENFNNYWCLTTFTKFPSLMIKLLEELLGLSKSEQTFFSILCLMKQGNKLGLLKKYWGKNNDMTIKNILIALEHSNAHIRMLAFDIVCIRHDKSLPHQMEYNLILEFLHNNVNTDSTVLRLAMISSLNYFLSQLHIYFINYIKDSSDIAVDTFVNFCKNIQKFIFDSLNMNGNYQRKISTVKITNTILNCFGEIHKKRKHQTKHSNTTLMEFLKEKKSWILDRNFVINILTLLKDPTEDIRENVVKLLLNHYYKDFKDEYLLHDLKEKAFTNLRSKFFYEIDCGKSMLKLLIHLLLKEMLLEDSLKFVEDIYNEGFNKLIYENNCKTNIMTSIENGTQSHSLISILYIVVDACVLHARKDSILEGNITELLNVLADIANQFAWDQEICTSSDFSKMNDMVQDIIIKSGFNFTNDTSETNISGQQQIVLNCLWLNVKASCDMASLLIKYNSEDIVACEKCLKIMTHVLETSRHKGAIESAGAALGRAIQYLSSLPEESSASTLPYILLKSKLNELIQQASNMASVTRRGAGLSIMVHRIVSSDMKKGKPLFNYFMEKLLETCYTTEDIPKSEDITNIENQMDLPKAIYIHFLTKIVTDSSLAVDVTYYSAKLVDLAFVNLTSPHWQIRNAALQLYGALVPRLIGQKKVSGIDDETNATVAYDELRTHSRNMWTFIINQLKNEHSTDTVQSHSNLVSVLNLLASCAKRYNFTYNIIEQKSADDELLSCLVKLLGSPIYTVRRLTAKSIFNIYSFETICNILINHDFVSENSLHGHLILLKQIHKYYYTSRYKSYFSEIKERLNIFSITTHSYMCRELFDTIFLDAKLQLASVKETVKAITKINYEAGGHLWVECYIKRYILSCSWDEVPEILQILTDRNCFEKCCEYLTIKLQCSEFIPECALTKIMNILFSFKYTYASSFLWKVMYEISLKIKSSTVDNLELSSVFNDMQGNLSYTMRYLLPLAARVGSSSDENFQQELSNLIFKYTNPNEADVDMRYIAALANNEMANHFNLLLDSTIILLIKSAVNLYQDEDEDVRNVSVFFYMIISRLEMPLQPYICMQQILDPTFLKSAFKDPQNSIKILHNDLSVTLLENSCHIIDKYNPFANDTKNIYFENKVLKKMIEKLSNALY